jgi:hypothetical protein
MRVVIVCMLVFTWSACGNANKEPRGILPMGQMEAILLDMNYAEIVASEGIENTITSDSARKEKEKVLYRQILDLYQVRPEVFMKSYQYYESEPHKMALIYKNMLALAESNKRMQDKIDVDQAAKDALFLSDMIAQDDNLWPHVDLRNLYWIWHADSIQKRNGYVLTPKQ